ncbi:sensor histidine kinase [Microbacterium invictum]|uniref:histidine kinase n=1 Tax=Microbacterium invictum TaxID=515415 RepID=A0ABZ0VBM0_9MICO|nr:ATP-binding protein [Microbacterium invictum]WQB70202.1 ATP-binding protein [Microbacterium invictum]
MPGERLDRSIRALIVLMVAVNVIYLGALLLPGDPASLLIDVWMSITAQWVPVAVFWLVAVRTRFRRWEVILAAAGVTFNAAGDTVYALAMGADGVLPSPSLADLGYLLYYPLTMAALVLLVRRQSARSLRAALFDAGVASLGAAAVLAVLLAPIFTDASSATTTLDAAIAALYPLFDLLLITAAVGVSASPALRLGPRWQLLVLGFLLFAGADVAYALLSHAGIYAAGSPLDVLWTAGLACAAVWVDGFTRSDPAMPRARSHAPRLPVPAFAVLAGLGVLLLATQTSVSTVALALAAATVVLAAVSVLRRQATLARLLEGQEDLVRQLQKLDASKSSLIDTMSHEMRTPLTSILGYLDLVLDDQGVSPDTKDMLRVIERNAHRLQSLAGTMLQLTRLEAGEAPATARVAMAQVLRRVEESMRPLAVTRNVALHFLVDHAADVAGDEGQLERAVTNLVENAVKFTPPYGSVRVHSAPAAGPHGEPAVRIDVSDTGIGIPTDDVPHLFDRFFRAANAQDRSVQGTGLGLAIVREIVRAHGGEVSVRSVLGEGSTFRVTLPALPVTGR